MRIVITCALPVEFNEARNQLCLTEITNKIDQPRVAESGNITLLYTGIGKINSVLNLYDLLLKLKPDIVIDSGTSGALTTEVRPLDVVYSYKSTEFYSYDFKGESFTSDKIKILKMLSGIDLSEYIVASIEDSVDSSHKKLKLISSGASLVTWETSAIYKLCNKLNILCFSGRVITDCCNENTNNDFKNNRVQASKKLYNSIKNLCIGI